MDEFIANGYDDYKAGNTVNPYPAGGVAHDKWNIGYDDALQDETEACYMPEDDNYIGDDYYPGTGELIGDESYINYLNNY